MKAKPTLRGILAKNVKAALVRRKRSVVTVADFAGVSSAHLYDIIGCRKAATVDIIEKVAAAVGVEAADLLRRQTDGYVAPTPRSAGKKPRAVKSSASGRSRVSRGRAAVSRS